MDTQLICSKALIPFQLFGSWAQFLPLSYRGSLVSQELKGALTDRLLDSNPFQSAQVKEWQEFPPVTTQAIYIQI